MLQPHELLYKQKGLQIYILFVFHYSAFFGFMDSCLDDSCILSRLSMKGGFYQSYLLYRSWSRYELTIAQYMSLPSPKYTVYYSSRNTSHTLCRYLCSMFLCLATNSVCVIVKCFECISNISENSTNVTRATITKARFFLLAMCGFMFDASNLR